jgi:hypothetical protein
LKLTGKTSHVTNSAEIEMPIAYGKSIWNINNNNDSIINILGITVILLVTIIVIVLVIILFYVNRILSVVY